MLNQAATALSFFVLSGRESARSICAEGGTHFAFNVLFQAGRIGLRRRRTLRTRINDSVYAASREDSARMTSEDGVTVSH